MVPVLIMEVETMNSDSEKSDDWIDFKTIKIKTEVRPVLEYFGILEHLKPHGQELVGWCPFDKEHGKEDSFAFNADKKSFQCFACKARGSVLDFIAKLRGVTLREAAKVALEILGEREAEKETGQADRKAEKGRPYGKPIASPHSDAKRPEKPKETKRPESKEKHTGRLSVFTWSHAEFLIQAHKLDPSRLVVLDMNALESLMKITVEKEEENTAE